jgi:hypothetical protein
MLLHFLGTATGEMASLDAAHLQTALLALLVAVLLPVLLRALLGPKRRKATSTLRPDSQARPSSVP